MNDPRLPIGEEDWGEDYYTEDVRERGIVARTLLEERFPRYSFEALPSSTDQFVFIDKNESGDRRIFYIVIFLEKNFHNQKGVRIHWNRFKFFRDTQNNLALFPLSLHMESDDIHGVRVGKSEFMAADADTVEGFQPVWGPFHEVCFKGQWQKSLASAIYPWEEFLRTYGLKTSREYDWITEMVIEFSPEEKETFIFDALTRSDLVPTEKLGMIGVGPLEDVINDQVMSKLESFERTHSRGDDRKRLFELISGIYVNRDPRDIQVRWMKLLKNIGSREQLKELESYFETLN